MDKKKETNYYQLLGVDPEAGHQEIKKAFRELAHKYHPDKGKEDQESEMFLAVTNAYRVLSDYNKRVLYDHYGPSLAPETDETFDLVSEIGALIENVKVFWNKLQGRTNPPH